MHSPVKHYNIRSPAGYLPGGVGKRMNENMSLNSTNSLLNWIQHTHKTYLVRGISFIWSVVYFIGVKFSTQN